MNTLHTTIAPNSQEISTEIASFELRDVIVPDGAKPLLKRRMRCRIIDCHPGKVIDTHSHENRPAILYVLEGAGEEKNDRLDGIRIWKKGDCFAEYNQTVHRIVNRSETAPLKVLAVDLVDDTSDLDAHAARSIHYPRDTIAVNSQEFATELMALYLEDVIVPSYGKPLMERRMRCRLLECHPGKVIETHSHENRPAILYVLDGYGEESNEKFKGKRIWKPGDCFAEYNDNKHRIVNLSNDKPLIIITVDLYDDSQEPEFFKQYVS